MIHADLRPAYWLGASWKMHKTIPEATAYATSLAAYVARSPTGGALFVIPPFTAIASVAAALSHSGVGVGAQDLHPEDDGPHTGDVSGRMIADAGATLVEIGHQERRRDHRETDLVIRSKVQQALVCGLTPLLCVGETADEHQCGAAEETVSRQLKIATSGLSVDDAARLLIAYEPAWSIGVEGTAASPPEVAVMHAAILTTLRSLFGPRGGRIPVLYGGSVDPDNAGAYVAVNGVAGLFVGRSALDVEGFIATDKAVRSALASCPRVSA